MRIQPRYTFKLLIIGTIVLLTACGPKQEGESQSDSFVNLNEFSIIPAIMADGEQLQVEWDVSHASPSGLYTFELHISEDSLALSDQTRIFSVNCPLHASCQSDGMALRVCEYHGEEPGQPASITCGGSSTDGNEISQMGNLLAIGRACIFDENAARLCDSQSIAIQPG